MSARPGIGSVARCRRRPRPSAGSGPVPIPSTGSGRRRYCPCSKGMPPAGSGRRQLSSALRQAQEEEKFPGRFSASQLRPLQRRLQALRQAHEAGAERPEPGGLLPPGASPGREAQLDFTHCNSLRVTIGGRPYRHRLFQLVLSHSGWRYAEVATGETFLALKQGLQNALWELGGSPRVIRSDNTSALTHEIKRSRGRSLNDSYAELLDHYGLESTLINSGESHENGVAEQAHYRLKDAIDQALMLRGSRDFNSLEEYTGFVRKVMDRRNRLVQGKLEEERPRLRPLPPAPVPEYVNHRARVRKWSTIQPFDRLSSGTDLLRALPAHREGGADPVVRRALGSVLQGHLRGADGKSAERAGGPRRLPPRHRLPGAQARGLRQLPASGADVSQHDLSPRIRCAPGMAGRTRRRGVRAHPAPGCDHHGDHGGRPRWTAPWPCSWRPADPSTTARSGSWPIPRRYRRRHSACPGCRT